MQHNWSSKKLYHWKIFGEYQTWNSSYQKSWLHVILKCPSAWNILVVSSDIHWTRMYVDLIVNVAFQCQYGKCAYSMTKHRNEKHDTENLLYNVLSNWSIICIDSSIACLANNFRNWNLPNLGLCANLTHLR